MNINENVKDDLLGYEIIKDGKVIAFTTSSTYIDKNADENTQYEVVPYAKDLTKGNKVDVNSSKPIISVQQEKITQKEAKSSMQKITLKVLLTQARK